jgi:hypothetical protein
MKSSVEPDADLSLLAPLAVCLSFASFLYWFRHGDLLLYGDAVAHINIARRVVDSLTPGLLQLGTVWLPLPHLLMLPFIVSRSMWQTGMGASIPTLLAYVMAVIGIFRLLRTFLPSPAAGRDWGTRFAAWFGAAIFALNPNLLYLQSTAMTEPLYLALSIWALVYFSSAIASCQRGEAHARGSPLLRAGLCLAGASWTRYDGWFLAAVMVAIVLTLAWRGNFTPLKGGAKQLFLVALAAPLLWVVYNAIVYHNAWEFANGPYSAKAIEHKTQLAGMPPHPGKGDPVVAFEYFFKSAELNLANRPLGWFWVCGLLAGSAVVLLKERKLWPLLLLWAPVAFYTLSIAYGAVPLFLPVWWPFSYYNVRYGIEMLPAFAVFVALAAYELIEFLAHKKVRVLVAAVSVVLVGISYAQVLLKGPISFGEAVANGRSRVAVETQLASLFENLPATATLLMYLGDHVGALQRAGIPLRRVINEGNHRPWKRPLDPEGLWERALAHPARYVDYVIEVGDDPVAQKVENSELVTLEIVHVSGQPPVVISRTTRGNQAR